jgi:hypothetical protein
MLMKAPTVLMCALATLALGACAQERPGDRPAVSPKARIVGEPLNCVPLTQVRESRIRDDWTIDFVGVGGQVWRNTLTNRCPGLRAENAITYETSLTQLCNVDIVYVLQNFGGRLQRGPACSLGRFVPVELERR